MPLAPIDFAARRAAVLDAIEGAIMIVPAAPVAIRNNDVHHPYRQDSDLFYLTGFDEEESILVLSAVHAEHRAVLFMRERNPERETWDGPRLGTERAIETLGIDAAFPIEKLAEELPKYFEGARDVHYTLGVDAQMDRRIFAARRRARPRARFGITLPDGWVDVSRTLHPMRLVKTGPEIERMREAARISAEAFEAAFDAARSGRFEYEVEAAMTSTYRRSGAERPAYDPIVGSGPNACILHHKRNDRQMQPGELLLIDAGVEFQYYAADITRTFPIDGAFTDAQREVYEVVLEAQVACIEATKPGASMESVHHVALRVLTEGMVRIGLLEGEVDKLIEDKAYLPYYMHRTSHWLGMDVHDVGGRFQNGEPIALSPGMVITIEPGLYIAPDGEAPERFRGIGIRIEDDVVVTPDGCEVLTDAVPKTVEALEARLGARA